MTAALWIIATCQVLRLTLIVGAMLETKAPTDLYLPGPQ